MTNHCTLEQSLALKEIEFDMPVRDYYLNGRRLVTPDNENWNAEYFSDSTFSAPTPSEVLQWARDKHGIDAWVQVKLNDDTGTKRYVYYIFQSMYYGQSAGTYPTHPEAESALVWKIIELIKEIIKENIHDKLNSAE